VRVTIVGSGHGVPEAHKQCTAILVEVGGRHYFIDAGCDINMALADRRIHPDTVKALFITHPHTDHIDGLYPFLGLLAWHYTTANPAVYVPNEACATLVHRYFEAFDYSLRPEQKLAVVEAGLLYDDGYLKVTAIPTKHCPHSFAYLLEAEGKRVLCSGDLAAPSVDFPPVDDLDAAILEGAHFHLTEYVPILKARNIRSVYINHYGNYISRINNQGHFQTLRDEISPIPAYLTTDGMEFTL
jgi:ribonuclease Z